MLGKLIRLVGRSCVPLLGHFCLMGSARREIKASDVAPGPAPV